MSDLLVSVVLTTYNVEKYIKQTINSVISQTYRNIEIVVIDDGSTDKTLEILKSFLNTGISIIIEPRVHSGNIGKNLNDCIKLSNGEIIAILGADDLWFPEKTEVQLKYLKEYKFVCSDKNIIDEFSVVTSGGDGLKSNELTLNTLLFRNDILASSLIGFKDSFIECGLFDETVGNRSEDYALWLRIAEKYKIKYVKQVLVSYRIHGNNLSNRTFEDLSAVLNRNIELISSYLQYEDDEVISSAKAGIAAIYNRFAIYKFYEKDFDSSFVYLKLSFSVYKGDFRVYYFKRVLFYLLLKIKILFKIKKIGFEKKFIKKW